MNSKKSNLTQNPKEDFRSTFKKAYENRYTWDDQFKGYKGNCSISINETTSTGSFYLKIGQRPEVLDLSNKESTDLISSQLFEVSIHRVRRPFDQVHSENIFNKGQTSSIGTEVLVSGKSEGDKYYIKNNIITMVHRHIHGSLINIFTHEVFQTGKGYLSASYSSQYVDPITKKPLSKMNYFQDKYKQITTNGYWVLSDREIKVRNNNNYDQNLIKYSFYDLCKL